MTSWIRPIWWATTAVLAGPGVVVALIELPLPLLIVIAVCTAVVTAVGPSSSDNHTVKEHFTRSLGEAIATHLVLAVAAAGLIRAAGVSAVVLILVLAATSPPARRRYVHKPSGSATHSMAVDAVSWGDVPGDDVITPGRDNPAHLSATPVTPLQLSTAQLTTGQLCLAWRRSFPALASARTAAGWARVVMARAAYLEELERRDPAGFRRWMADAPRPASDPARYLNLGAEGPSAPTATQRRQDIRGDGPEDKH